MRMRDYQELNSRLDIKQVAADYGLHVNRHGFANCPFHREKTASLKLYNDSFFCFGCEKGGDTIALVAGIRGISQSEAYDELNNRYAIGIVTQQPLHPRRKVSPQWESWKQHALDAVAWYCRLCWLILYRAEGMQEDVRSFFQHHAAEAEELHQALLESTAMDAYKELNQEVKVYEQLHREYKEQFAI